METIRNITRYDNTKGTGYSFTGWRLCLTRKRKRFVRYFSDRSYGSAQSALEAACVMRDIMLQELDGPDADYAVVFEKYSKA